MGFKKLIRFGELEQFPNVLQHPENMAGNWKEHFSNNHPLVLELACGKGEYTLGLSRLYPDRNFIGVDIKGHRLWVGAKKALAENRTNVAFLRAQIEQLHHYFAPGEVAEIWITFPDPQLRYSKAKKRLTHPRFLRLYQQVLQPGGQIHLKTDSPALYQFTRLVLDMYQAETLQATADLYAMADPAPDLTIKTHYELLDIAASQRIHYIRFKLPQQLPGPAQDERLKEAIQYELDRG